MRIPFILLILVSCTLALGQESTKSFTPGERSTGYYSTLTAGLLVPNPNAQPSIDIGSSGLPIHIKVVNTHGYRFNRFASLGLGTGMMILDRGMVLPLLLDFRGDVLKGEITPTYYAQFGTSIPLYGRDEVVDWWGNPVYEEFKAKGGPLLDIGIGIKVRGAGRSSTMLTIGYQAQTISESYQAWGTRFQQTYSFQRLSLQAGWMF